MSSAPAELSSIAAALDEIVKRVAGIASAYDEQKRGDVAQELMDIERSLETASRRLAKAVDMAS